MRSRLLPYKMASESACALASALGILRVYPDRAYKPRATDLVINYGMSRAPAWAHIPRWLNVPSAVARASNKLGTFGAFQTANVPCVPWTADRAVALGWLAEGAKVVARTVLSGHSGEGIVLASTPAELVEAPLYTRYVPKRTEYRAHVVDGTVIDVTEKRLRRGGEPSLIRNHASGYVFCREGIQAPADLAPVALAAVSALGLDFGAVDILQSKRGACLAIEVNTAPGLEGTTLERYAIALRRFTAPGRTENV